MSGGGGPHAGGGDWLLSIMAPGRGSVAGSIRVRRAAWRYQWDPTLVPYL